MGHYLNYRRCSAEAFATLSQAPAALDIGAYPDNERKLELLSAPWWLAARLCPEEQAGPGLGPGPTQTTLGRALLGSHPLYPNATEEERDQWFDLFEFGPPYYLDPLEVAAAVVVLADPTLLERVNDPERPSLAESLAALQKFYRAAAEAGEYVVTWGVG